MIGNFAPEHPDFELKVILESTANSFVINPNDKELVVTVAYKIINDSFFNLNFDYLQSTCIHEVCCEYLIQKRYSITTVNKSLNNIKEEVQKHLDLKTAKNAKYVEYLVKSVKRLLVSKKLTTMGNPDVSLIKPFIEYKIQQLKQG